LKRTGGEDGTLLESGKEGRGKDKSPIPENILRGRDVCGVVSEKGKSVFIEGGREEKKDSRKRRGKRLEERTASNSKIGFRKSSDSREQGNRAGE